jgi:hypothetical protein
LQSISPAHHAVSNASTREARPARNPDDRLPLGIMLAIPLVATLAGLPYYLMGPGERLRSPLHPLLKPAASVGLAFGVAALVLFLFMWLYPLRKQFRWLAFTGSAPAWLRNHVLVGLALPFIAAVHAGWRFDGLIGLGYLAMVLVSLSGLVGRYLYVRIPRSRGGVELSLDEAAGERRAILTRIALETGLDPVEIDRAIAVHTRPLAGLGLGRAFAHMISNDVARWRAMRALRREWSRPRPGATAPDPKALGRALALARREMALTQQLHMLDATRRVFAFWHVAHRPFAITALLAVLIHVVVAVAVGGVRLP